MAAEPVPADQRASKEVVDRQSQLILQGNLLQAFCDALSEIVFILNRQRQIVFCNQKLPEMLGVGDRRQLYGQRPGEVIGCAHAKETPGGCGASEACEFCGVVQAVLSRQELADARDAQILLDQGGGALDMRVCTRSLALGGEEFVLVAMTDISHEKRRRALERIFFHDLMNTGASLRLVADMTKHVPPEKLPAMAARMRHSVNRLLDEIASQRDLMAAENNELSFRPITIEPGKLLSDLIEDYEELATPRGCTLCLDGRAQNREFVSDATILSRVLGNMIKNGIEASGTGQAVTVGCQAAAPTGLRFWVHNAACMSREVQLQLFKRSFSTKGSGRGLGTYSIRLLTEKYLRGEVSFTSTPEQGTTFMVTLPLRVGAEGSAPAGAEV